MGCFYHSKIEASSACRRCMIPICEDCTRERYCPECHKMAQYVRQGHSGPRQGNLVVEDNQRRASLTRQLMINRLANNVLADTPAAETERQPARRPAPVRRGPARKQGRPVGAIAASVLAMVAAFSLGTIFSRPPAQAAAGSAPIAAADAPAENVASSRAGWSGAGATHPQPVAPADPAAPAVLEAGDVVAAPAAARAEIVYADVPPSELLPQTAAMPRGAARELARDRIGAQAIDQAAFQVHPVAVPALPAAPRSYVGQTGRAALQALAAQAQPNAVAPGEEALVPDLPAAPAAAAAAPAAPAMVARAEVRPTLSMSWPVAGNTLRMTSYLKVRVTNPGHVSVLNVTVDGKPFAPVHSVAARNEIPVDTTQLPNGDHRIQVMAMTESGDIITSDAVPVTVLN